MLIKTARMVSTIIYASFFIISCAYCDQMDDPIFKEMEKVSTNIDPQDLDTEFDEKLVYRFEKLSAIAEKNRRQDTIHYADGKLYDEMNYILDELAAIMRNYNSTHRFLRTKGIDRIILPNLKVDNDELKARLLILLKVLFDVDPSATIAFIPITMVDRLLHIFEHDNLALKAHALDNLYNWLPNNPKVQSRVMKLKGLQPFYEQISKLDTNVIKTLLDLFNKILNEHQIARSQDNSMILDSETLQFYQRTGLLEHMSNPKICNGLLNIFITTWSYHTKDNNILMSVFGLLKNVKPYCAKVYRGTVKAHKLFLALQAYVQMPENKQNFISHGFNMTDVTSVVEEYLGHFNYSLKDEF